jgi:hypothetical protein
LAVQSIAIAGQTRQVKKIMTYKTAWMQKYYYNSIEGLKYYLYQKRAQEEARQRQALAVRAATARSARPNYSYSNPQSGACVIS